MTELDLIKGIVFVVASLVFAYVTRGSVRDPRSHGFYRFLAWEAMLALLLVNVDYWLNAPLAAHQLVSWFLLCVSLVLVVIGVAVLHALGKPSAERNDPSLLGIERTTQLVTAGVYHYIRHPMYSSLLFLTWGVFFKSPSWLAAALAVAATAFLTATAKVEETENRRFFGLSYDAYRRHTRMFIPFLV